MTIAMTEMGHMIHAKALYDCSYYLAWGDLPTDYADSWSLGETPPVPLSVVETENVIASGSGSDTLSAVGVLKIISPIISGTTNYYEGTDYSVAGKVITWITSGPAVGVSYTVTLRRTEENITSLLKELGRRIPLLKQYVTPDENGDIVANGATWSVSETPTRHLYLMFKFEATEAVDKVIYQIGLFTNPVLSSSVLPGQQYFIPSDLVDPGSIYLVDNVEPFSRPAGKREIFEFVLTF